MALQQKTVSPERAQAPHMPVFNHVQGNSGYGIGDIADAEPAGGEVDSASAAEPAKPQQPPQETTVTEADVHAAAAWLLYQLAQFCGRHMRKVSVCGVCLTWPASPLPATSPLP